MLIPDLVITDAQGGDASMMLLRATWGSARSERGAVLLWCPGLPLACVWDVMDRG